MALRPYQVDAIARVQQCYRDGARAVLLQLPTGGGKTHAAASGVIAPCRAGVSMYGDCCSTVISPAASRDWPCNCNWSPLSDSRCSQVSAVTRSSTRRPS